MTTQEIELSERLRKACLEKGITEPRFVAQDKSGAWWHYKKTPVTDNEWTQWYPFFYDGCLLFNDQPNENWRETLMEFNPNVGLPLADVLKRTCEHCGKEL